MSVASRELIENLHQSGSLKVWSLIISFFGDAVEPRGGIVAASTLQSVMEVMGVGSGAVRTACSRLAKDGWIERQRQGRNSFFRLSETGHTQFKQASRQIYAPPVRSQRSGASATHEYPASQSDTKFTLIVQNPLNTRSTLWQSLLTAGIRINANSVLLTTADMESYKLPGNSLEFQDMMVLSNATARFPDWIKRSVCSDESAQRYLQLMQRFDAVRQTPPTDPLTSLAVRCLLIHEWRRLLLRNRPVPEELTPSDWPLNDCHQFVATLYRKLFQTGEQWMDENAHGPFGFLKLTDHNCVNRFSSNDRR